MGNQKKLSVVIPTYNRKSELELTLNLLLPQMKRNLNEVEIIICNNNSTDDTLKMLSSFKKECNDLQVVNYSTHVEVGESITRSVANAKSKYVLLWGDDDFPSPFMIDTLLYYILRNTNSKIGLIHFNRLTGIDIKDNRLGLLNIVKRKYKQETLLYKSSNEFINDFYLDTSFLSSICFLKEVWDKGDSIDSSNHFGYEFLAPIYWGSKGYNYLYINYPLCIQRLPRNRSWLYLSPYYRFLGITNMLKDFQKWGLINDWESLWNKEANTLKAFLHVAPHLSLNKSFYKPKLSYLFKSQKYIYRKIIILLFIYLFPSSLYKFIRRKYFKKI